MLKDLYSCGDAFLLIIEHKRRLPILTSFQLHGSIVSVKPLEVHEEGKGIVSHVAVMQLDRGTLLYVLEASFLLIDFNDRARQFVEFLSDGRLRRVFMSDFGDWNFRFVFS